MQPLWPSCQSHSPVCQITDVSNGDTCIYPMSFSVASGRTSQGEKKVTWRFNDTCHQFCFPWALVYRSTERASDTTCHKNVMYLCNVTVRAAYVVGHQTSLLLLRQQTKKCRIGTRLTENNAKCRRGAKPLCRVRAFIRAAQSCNLSLSLQL